MKRSHLVDAFLQSAWYLHAPVYDRLSDLLHAHLLGRKSELRVIALDGGEAAPAQDQPDEASVDTLLDGGIALIDVRGVLAMHADEINGDCQPRGRSYESIRRQLDLAVADPAVRSIVLMLETPGGCALGCQETFDAIRSADAVKPVYAYKTGYCFSAGEYLASACRMCVAASPMTECGSIGTIASAWDTSAAATEAGYKRIVWRAGAYKALIQDGEPISDVAIAEEQRVVDAYGAAFHDAVRAGRGLTAAQAEAVLNGRTFFAKDAIALGLVDAITPFPEFIAGLAGPEPPMFGLSKPKAATAANPPTQPAAAGASQESCMKSDVMAALAALCDSHPTHARALTKAACQPTATVDGLKLLAAQLDNQALTEQLASARSELAAAKTAAATAAEANTKALADKDREIERLHGLAGLAKGVKDVGGERSANDKVRSIPLSQQSQMTEADHADVRAGRAVLIDDVSKRHTAAQSSQPAPLPAAQSAPAAPPSAN